MPQSYDKTIYGKSSIVKYRGETLAIIWAARKHAALIKNSRGKSWRADQVIINCLDQPYASSARKRVCWLKTRSFDLNIVRQRTWSVNPNISVHQLFTGEGHLDFTTFRSFDVFKSHLRQTETAVRSTKRQLFWVASAAIFDRRI